MSLLPGGQYREAGAIPCSESRSLDSHLVHSWEELKVPGLSMRIKYTDTIYTGCKVTGR